MRTWRKSILIQVMSWKGFPKRLCLKQWFLKVIATFKNSIQEPTIWESWKVGFVYITAICHSTLLWFKNHRCCLLVLLMARHTGFLCQAVFNWWLFSVVFLIMTVLGKGHKCDNERRWEVQDVMGRSLKYTKIIF